jgi:ABC-type nickel/cobalt efflux system permease component RcnA
MFAIELMMPEVSVETFLPVAIATGTATFVGRWFFGDSPAFHVPPLQAMAVDPSALVVLVLFAVLGALTGVVAAGFIRGLHLAEDIFDRIKFRYLRHMLGMLILGVLMYLLFRTLGQYYVDGVGYATVQAVLRDRSHILAAGAAVRLQGVGDLAQSGLGLIRRHFLAVAVHGRDPWRRLCRAAEQRRPAHSAERSCLRHGRHGSDGGRWNRRGDDRRHNDLRDDPRLQHRDADDRGGGDEHRHTPGALSRDHLHLEARAPRPCHSKGAPREHVPGPFRARCDGRRHPGVAGGSEFR